MRLSRIQHQLHSPLRLQRLQRLQRLRGALHFTQQACQPKRQRSHRHLHIALEFLVQHHQQATGQTLQKGVVLQSKSPLRHVQPQLQQSRSGLLQPEREALRLGSQHRPADALDLACLQHLHLHWANAT